MRSQRNDSQTHPGVTTDELVRMGVTWNRVVGVPSWLGDDVDSDQDVRGGVTWNRATAIDAGVAA